ncbi:uncharacterized protein AMSG_12130 [Thecamonas trahens ATCC 50062]|uniref:Condensin complex subunit 2 n=1 Tax=Thecamonas trahens ATCC 50062 TaxID=461836 RepID=A0A0L0DJU7_THETB|nr:hypothetical protein AMSG_12130 [Thecamonas trahens ATCC 50062]KNC52500.1 hypothetical protein AMSG_12130 [Thecamonas trahens ATCC 50062]|eukprot:XP_013755373.1 hypothetical protein AMSG_12130 [Thecamonas trahens ATCC 50062]
MLCSLRHPRASLLLRALSLRVGGVSAAAAGGAAEGFLQLPRGKPLAKISAEYVEPLPPAEFAGKITVTASLDEANEAAAAAGWWPRREDPAPGASKPLLLGMDAENALHWDRTTAKSAPTCVLQLASDNAALVLSIARPAARAAFADRSRPNAVRDLIEAHDVALVCQGAAGDVGPLHSEFGMFGSSFVDLLEVSALAGLYPLKLRYAVAQVLRLRLSKKEQMSNWRRWPLTPSQVAYAATDAWAPLAVYRGLAAAHPHLAAAVDAQLAAGGPPPEPGAPRLVVSTRRMLAKPLPAWAGPELAAMLETPFDDAASWPHTHPMVLVNNLASYYRARVVRSRNHLGLRLRTAAATLRTPLDTSPGSDKRTRLARAALALLADLSASPDLQDALIESRLAALAAIGIGIDIGISIMLMIGIRMRVHIHIERLTQESLAQAGAAVAEEMRGGPTIGGRKSIAPGRKSIAPGRKSIALRQPRKSILPPPLLSGIQLTDLYSNCLKMSAENKINQKNTWGLNLIDYIDDIVEEDETDFARASCTIDASIKIYSTRVDAVHIDTYKVLGGLARTNGPGGENGEDDADAGGENKENDEFESDDDDDEYSPGGKRKAKTKTKDARAAKAKASATLEANIANLNTDALDLDFDIDPLFQKTSAEFDEGGARGLLLNHLTLSEYGQLIFGSHISISSAGAGGATRPEPEPIDFTDARKIYGEPEYASLQICPEFVTFAAAQWGRNVGPAPSDAPADAPADAAADTSATSASRADFFAAMAATTSGVEEAVWEEADFDDDDDDDDAGAGSFRLHDSGLSAASLGMTSFSSAGTSSSDALASLFGAGHATAAAASALDSVLRMTKESSVASEYGFFAPGAVKSWAGPTNWKYSGSARARAAAKSDGSAKSKKAKFFLQLAPPLAIDLATLGKTSSKSTTLKASTLAKASKDAHLLPPDIHYDIAELTHFALRPSFALSLPGAAAAHHPTSMAAALSSRGGGFGGFGSDNDDDDNGEWAFFGDAPDAPGAGTDLGDADVDLLDDPRRVAKIDINYERVAKKVDVKALKRGVWAQLTVDEPREALASKSALPPRMDDERAVTFSSVVADLPSTLPRRVMQDASVPFAFICLLHLCNEKGLMIEGSPDMTDFVVRQDPDVVEPDTH